MLEDMDIINKLSRQSLTKKHQIQIGQKILLAKERLEKFVLLSFCDISLVWKSVTEAFKDVENKKDFTSKLVTQNLDDDGVYYIHTKQNVQPVIDGVKMLSETITPGKDLRHVAEIPMVVVQRAMREGWFNDGAKIKAWLNDPDNDVFRTWKGKV